MSEAQGHSNDVDFDFDDSALDQFDGVTVEGERVRFSDLALL